MHIESRMAVVEVIYKIRNIPRIQKITRKCVDYVGHLSCVCLLAGCILLMFNFLPGPLYLSFNSSLICFFPLKNVVFPRARICSDKSQYLEIEPQLDLARGLLYYREWKTRFPLDFSLGRRSPPPPTRISSY